MLVCGQAEPIEQVTQPGHGAADRRTASGWPCSQRHDVDLTGVDLNRQPDKIRELVPESVSHFSTNDRGWWRVAQLVPAGRSDGVLRILQARDPPRARHLRRVVSSPSKVDMSHGWS